MNRTAAVLVAVAVVGLFMLPACKKKDKGAPEHDVEEYVSVTVDGSGFHPNTIWAQRGQPITITFTRTTDDTSATEVLIAEENLRKKLPLDEPVKVVLLPGKKGRLRFACPKNTLSGEIVVQ